MYTVFKRKAFCIADTFWKSDMDINHHQHGNLTASLNIWTNCNYTGIFINFGSQIKVRRIISRIRAGDENLLLFLKLSCTPRECASALSQYLHKIGKPLLPKRIQQLLIADNKGICARTVALDALGLINEELEGTHLELFIAIMDLMKILSTVGSLRPTEVRVSHAPYLLMPLLFSTSEKLIKNWRSIADILNEMIICFDMYVQTPAIFQAYESLQPVYQGQSMARGRNYNVLIEPLLARMPARGRLHPGMNIFIPVNPQVPRAQPGNRLI